jgi:hypothetical protein
MEQTEPSFLTLQRDLEWRLAEVLPQVGKGVHVMHRPGIRLDVFPSARLGR